jgi:hypothetical protein
MLRKRIAEWQGCRIAEWVKELAEVKPFDQNPAMLQSCHPAIDTWEHP